MTFHEVPISDVIKSAQSGFASGKKDESGIAQIRMNNVQTDGQLDFSSIRRVPRNAVKNLDKYIIKEGDILFNATNSPNLVGKTALFVTQPEPFVFSNHFIRLKVKQNLIDSSYLARWLTLQQQKGVFELLCTRWVNQASVRKDDLLAQKIPLPPLGEQRRITAVLDKADALRQKRRAVLARLDTLLQATFLHMFGDPVTNPMGWEVVKLAKTFKIKPQIGTTKPAHEDGKQKVVRVGELGEFEVDLEKSRFLTLSEEDFKRYAVRPSDFLLARAIGSENHLGKASIVQNVDFPVVFDSHVMRLRFDEKILHPYFFSQWLKSKGGRARFMRQAGRTAVQFNINSKQMSAIKMPLPPISKQKEFVEIFEKSRTLHNYHENALIRLDNLFHALQQRAFSGQL